LELNLHASVILILKIFALLLFTQDKIRLEFSSLLILTLLVIFFTVYSFVKLDDEQVVAVDYF